MSDRPPEKPRPPQPDDVESTQRFDRASIEPGAEENDRTRSIPGGLPALETPVEGHSLDTNEIAQEGLEVEGAPESDLNRTVLAPTPDSLPGEHTPGRGLSTSDIKGELSLHDEESERERTAVVRQDEKPSAKQAVPDAEPEDEDLQEAEPNERTSLGTPISVARIDEIQEPPSKQRPAPPAPAMVPEAPTTFGTPVSVALVDAIQTGGPATPTSGTRGPLTPSSPRTPPKLKTAPPPPKIEFLPGEAEEQAPEPPYNLRPANFEETESATEPDVQQAGAKTKTRLWIAGGSCAGLFVFAIFYFLAPSRNYPFPKVQAKADKTVTPVLVQGVRGWVRRENYFIGKTEEPGAIHLYDSASTPPSFVGSLAAALPEESIQTLAIVGTPQLDGYVLAWISNGSVRWSALHNLRPELKTPIMKSPPPSEIPLRYKEEILFRPVRIEDTSGKSPDRFVVALHGPEHDSLMTIEIFHADKQILELDSSGADLGKIIGPALSFYDPKDENGSRLLVTTSKGVSLLSAGAEGLKSISGEGTLIPFEGGWDKDSRAGIMRARFGASDRGWLIASSEGIVAVALADGKNLKKMAGHRWEKPVAKAEKGPSEPPNVLTFPNAEHPDEDCAVIAFKDGTGYWISSMSKSEPKIEKISLRGNQPAAADLNGDGFWDLIGVDADGKFWVVDGHTRLESPAGVSAEGLPPVGTEVAWNRTGDALQAFYMSKTGEPARAAFPLQNLGRKELSEAARNDWEWREGKKPL